VISIRDQSRQQAKLEGRSIWGRDLEYGEDEMEKEGPGTGTVDYSLSVSRALRESPIIPRLGVFFRCSIALGRIPPHSLSQHVTPKL